MNLHDIKTKNEYIFSEFRYRADYENLIRTGNALEWDGCVFFSGNHYCVAAFDRHHRRNSDSCTCEHRDNYGETRCTTRLTHEEQTTRNGLRAARR